MKSYLTFIFFLSVIGFTNAKRIDQHYFQDIRKEISLPADSDTNVIKLYKTDNTIIALTPSTIYRYQEGRWSTSSLKLKTNISTIDSNGTIWLAGANVISDESGTFRHILSQFSQYDSVQCLFWENDKKLWAGSKDGLRMYDGEWHDASVFLGRRVYAITSDADHNLWVATDDGLFTQRSGTWINLDDMLMAQGLHRKYFSLEATNEGRDIIFGGAEVIGCIAGDGNHWLLNRYNGLPYGPVTTIRSHNNTLWLGTEKGVIKKDSTWHYFHGRRWLSDNRINDILIIDPYTVWVATPGGISEIKSVKMTLQQKSDIFLQRIEDRHVRYGLVSRSKLEIPGDLSSSVQQPTNNDGLWTGIYLAAESFRYAVTGSKEAKANACRAFEAMEQLENVTGIPGFPARTYIKSGDPERNGDWRWSPDKNWKWLGDTSSDEMVGHFFAYPIFYDLVADKKMKKRVETLLDRILRHIIDHNYQMMDLNNQVTRWGVWNPDSLNNSPNWLYEQGTNSLQILSFLGVGHYILDDEKYADLARELVELHGYGDNMVKAKKYGPFEVNYVDNQLAFYPYYTMQRYGLQFLQPYFEQSIRRTWNVVKKDKTSMWNIIASVSIGEDCDLDVALEDIQSIPVEMINWTMENSHRWDLLPDPINDRMNRSQATKPIPSAERGITKWNLNPYQLDSGAEGSEENDGAYYLLAYWMGRFHGYW